MCVCVSVCVYVYLISICIVLFGFYSVICNYYFLKWGTLLKMKCSISRDLYSHSSSNL